MIRLYFHPTPNPAMIDTEGAGGAETRVFDSSAILLYLAEKSGKFGGSTAERGELLSWLFFISSGLGPSSGQSVHFQRAAPEKLPYAINRYRREAARHYQVLDDHLKGREFLLSEYSIADMSGWGWVDRAGFVFGGDESPLTPFPNVNRWFRSIDARPAAARARKVGTDHEFKKVQDDEAKRHLYPSNYPPTAA